MTIGPGHYSIQFEWGTAALRFKIGGKTQMRECSVLTTVTRLGARSGVRKRIGNWKGSPHTAVCLRSGSCTSARTFAPHFFQTPRLDYALALRYQFVSIRL